MLNKQKLTAIFAFVLFFVLLASWVLLYIALSVNYSLGLVTASEVTSVLPWSIEKYIFSTEALVHSTVVIAGFWLSVFSSLIFVYLLIGYMFKEREASYKLQELKNSFVSEISHDLRSPLVVLEGYAEILLKSSKIKGADKDYVKRISQRTTELIAFVSELLDIRRIETGKRVLETEVFKVQDVLKKMYELHEPLTKEKIIKLTLVNNSPNSLVKAEARATERILQNLLSNAMKYTPKKGRIEIKGEVTENMFEVSVCNNGPVIPEEKQKQMFKKFFQADNKHLPGSSGLGLAISRELTETMGGELSLFSQEGSDTCFSFTIPLA